MSAEFDPYRKWLGIPPHELPPDHYRLLGIARFEDDPDVIENAANRQMAHVRTFQAGRHGQLSQQILNELSSARICLLNADKKQQYDAQLRSLLAPVPTGVPHSGGFVASPPPVVASPPLAALPIERAPPQVRDKSSPSRPLVATAPVRRSSVSSRHGARRRSSTVPMILGLIGAAILIGAAVVVLNTDLGKSKQPATPDTNRPRPASQPGGGERPSLRPRPGAPIPSPPSASMPMPTRPGSFADPVLDNPTPSNDQPSSLPSQASIREQQYRDAVLAARAALASRDTQQAMRDLERAGANQPTETQTAELERLRALRVYLDGFWDGVRRGISKEREAGQAFEHQGMQFELVGHEGDIVKFKVNGKELERPIRELEVPHARAFASRAFAEDDVFGMVYVAAFLVLDRPSASNPENRQQARKLLVEAARLSGDPNPYVAAELEIEPDTLRPPPSPDKPAGEQSDSE